MKFPLFLALRYLKPKRSVVSVITLFCVIGVMLGVGSLVVVISVINGFQEKLREDLLRLQPHLAVIKLDAHPSDESAEGNEPGWREVADLLRSQPEGVLAVWAAIEAPATIEIELPSGEKNLDPISIFAVEADKTDIGPKLDFVEGGFDLDGDNAVIPEMLASKWNFHVGDRIVIQSFHNAEQAYKMIDKWEKTPKEERGEAEKWFEQMKEVVTPAELTVSGIFRSRQHVDRVVVPLHVGREMMARGDDIDFLAVTTPDALRVGHYQQLVEAALPSGWLTETWWQRFRGYFDAVQSERLMLYAVLLIIMVVAGFCIVVTLATVAIHKRKEIGVVRSLGARVGQILAIFVGQGTIVGIVGTLLGLGGGLWFLAERMAVKGLIQWLFGIEILDPQIYGVAEIPCDVRADDLMRICGISLAISTLAGVLPALIAAWQDPAKALRSE